MCAAVNSAIVFPASPNWYCTKVSDCSATGVYGFGAKNYVILADPAAKIFLRPIDGHDQRVSAFSFCKAPGTATLCVSGCIGKRVKLWNIESYECVKHHNDHQAGITAVCTSPLIADLIVSADSDGKIIVWHWHTDERKTHVPISGQSIFAITCSPNDPDLVVIGYQSGNVVSVNVITGEVVHRLVGHVDEIHAMDWAPITHQQTNDSEEHEPSDEKRSPCLLTSSKDKTIRVWDATDFSLVTTLQIPKATGQFHEGQKTRIWITACFSPTNPDIIISSNLVGELIKWDIRNKNKQSKFSSGHSRPIFNITACLHGGHSDLITISMDRTIVMWDEKSRQKMWDVTSMGGFVYSMDINSTDPARLVAAIGDNTIRVCNLNYTEKTEHVKEPYQTHTIWKGLQSKVTVVRWHPEDMSTFAYGTEDGRIGLCKIDTNQPMLFQSYHKRTVYELEFGPSPPAHILEGLVPNRDKKPTTDTEPDKQSKYNYLYSCGGDGQIFLFNNSNSKASPININDIISRVNPNIGEFISKTKGDKIHFPQRSEFAWKKDFSLLAIGNVDGSVEIYNEQFKLLKVFKDHVKLINRIRWHECTEGEARWANVFASASSDFVVQVYDVTSLATAQGESKATATEHIGATSSEVLATLKGHKNSVVDLSWSMHEPHLVASCSYDGSIHVWDVLQAKAVHIMRGHFGKVLTISWSHVKAPVIYSGGEDQTIRRWNVTQFSADVDLNQPSKAKVKPKAKAQHPVASDTQPQEEVTSVPTTPTKTINEPVSIVSTSKTPKKGKSKSLFSNFDPNHDSRLQAHSSTLLFAQKMIGEESGDVDPHGLTPEHITTVSGLFETTKSIDSFVKSEEKTHQQANNWDPYLVLELWQGNAVEAFKTVVQQNVLNDAWLALSPMSGPEVWRQMNVVFAKHLETEGEIHRAVLHLLAINHIEEAIQTYQRAALFGDAIALARLRLHPQHPLITTIYLAWAQHLEERIMFEHAAKCYLAVNEHTRAVQAMARRGDLLAIKGAWQLSNYLLKLVDTDELRHIELDLREKLFLLYITSEIEGAIDFELLQSLLINQQLQYGLLVVTTWLALLSSLDKEYGSHQRALFMKAFNVNKDNTEARLKEKTSLVARVLNKVQLGAELKKEAKESSPSSTTNTPVHLIALFDSTNPFTADETGAAVKFYTTWIGLYMTLVANKLISRDDLTIVHDSLVSASDVLSRLQGASKKGDELLMFSLFAVSLVLDTEVPANKYIPVQYQLYEPPVKSFILALHSFYYAALNKRSYRLSALTRVIMPRRELSLSGLAQEGPANDLLNDLQASLLAYLNYAQLFWFVHHWRAIKDASAQGQFLTAHQDRIAAIKQHLLSDRHNQLHALEAQLGQLLTTARLAEEESDPERAETLKLQVCLVEKKIALVKQHVVLLPFPDLSETTKLLAAIEQK